MHAEIEILLFIVLIIAALISLAIKNLLTAVVTLSVFSFISALLYTSMGAVDVGFTEAVVGGGVTGVLLVILIFRTSRKDRSQVLGSKTLSYLILILFCGILIYASTGLPNRGDMQAYLNQNNSPAGSPNAGSFYIRHAYEDTHTPNMVTAILADYRGFDTLGEETVIFIAGLICFLLLRKKKKIDDET